MAPGHERGFVRIDGACASACCEPRACCDEPADDPCDSDKPVDPTLIRFGRAPPFDV